ncbi:TlpA family protein disulfide reductase [Candidatus Woesearchaeota archaeon]|nr:TlpA family protein disulfide reductase [Candidatus Woesearchaeota archaeon]
MMALKLHGKKKSMVYAIAIAGAIMMLIILQGCARQGNADAEKSNQAALARLDALQERLIGAKTLDHIDAPEFSLTGINGEKVTKQSLLGSPYILQGFASWCATCIEEAKKMRQVYSEYSDNGLKIVYVSVWDGETNETITEFKNRVSGPDDWSWHVDTDQVALKFEMISTSSTIIIDREGKMVYRDDDESRLDRIIAEVQDVV